MRKRAAFTLIEVLIAIALMGLILPALYQSVDLLRESNRQLYDHLQKSKQEAEIAKTFFLDIASSDGNLTIRNGEYDRICIERCQNSLYGLNRPKVCWIVLKKENTLARVEGEGYRLPTNTEDKVAVDLLLPHVTLFDIYRNKGEVLVLLQQEKKEPLVFMVEGVTQPKKKKKKKPKKPKLKQATTTETNTTALPSEPIPSPSPSPTLPAEI